MNLLALVAVALAGAFPAPPWITRVVPPPVVTWRAADVLATPVVEGIAVRRGPGATFEVIVVDSRYDPPQWAREREGLAGKTVRWLRAGTRDGLPRGDIALGVTRPGGETAYLLRVRSGHTLQLVRTVRGARLEPTVFSR